MAGAAHHPSYMCGHQRALAAVRRDLHDQVGSSLAGMVMAVEVAQLLIGADTAEAQRVLTEVRGEVTDMIAEVRRIVAACEQPGRRRSVAITLRKMVGRMNRVASGGLEITLDMRPGADAALDDVGWAAFWIVREAIANVLKHAMADHCRVSLLIHDGELVVKIEDDGVGIADKPDNGGFGLVNMAERAAEQGGRLTIGPGGLDSRGTAVVARFPLPDTEMSDQSTPID